MTVYAKAGAFIAQASTGHQSVTGHGFQPTVDLFACTLQNGSGTEVGSQGTARLNFGAAVASNQRDMASGYSRALSATSNTMHVFKTDKIISMNVGAGNTTPTDFADFVSQDADGFTVDWLTAIEDARIPYLSLGGVSASSSTFTLNSSTGHQSISGLGFEPKLVILYTTAPDTSSGGQLENYFCFGAATSSSNRFANSFYDRNNVGNAQSRTQMTSSKVFQQINQTAVVAAADFVSMDSDGFTIDITTATGAGILMHYLAIGGSSFRAQVGGMTQPLTNTNSSVTGVGFIPNAMIFSGAALPTLDTLYTPAARAVIGFATSPTDCGYAGMRADNNAPTMYTARQLEVTKCLGTRVGTTAGADPFIGQAALSTFDSDGFTLAWTDVNGSALLWQYIAMSVPVAIGVEPASLGLNGNLGASGISFTVEASVTIVLDIASELALASGSDLVLDRSFSLGDGIDPGGELTLDGSADITVGPGITIGTATEPGAMLTLTGSTDIEIIKPIVITIGTDTEPGAMLNLDGNSIGGVSCQCLTVSTQYDFGQGTQIVDIITEAFERCGIDGTAISGTMLDSARRSLEYMFVDWANNGPNLFLTYLYTIDLVPGTQSYTLPENTIYVVNAATRQVTSAGRTTDLLIGGISRAEYLALPQKQQVSNRPTQFYLERSRIPVIYPWPVLQANAECQLLVYLLRATSDISKFCGAIDGPQRIMNAAAAGLAAKLSTKYAWDRRQALKEESNEAYALMTGEDRERVPYRITINNPWGP